MSNKPIFVDGHGQVDVFTGSDYTFDLKMRKTATDYLMEGCTLNSLLKGIILLFSATNANEESIYGGVACWENAVEPMFCCLLCIASVEDILVRIVCCVQENIKRNESDRIHGSLSFLYFWLSSFQPFISDMDILKMSESVNQLSEIIDCGGVDNTSYKLHICKIKSMACQAIRKRNQMSCTNPNLWLTKGQWTGYDVQLRREQFKVAMAAAPKLKLEIFGGDQLMDAFDDDSEDGMSVDMNKYKGSRVGTGTNILSAVAPVPQPRIQDGQSLLQAPSVLTAELLHIDTLELARQWTLIDHALFCAIPLHALLPCASVSHSQPRYRLLRCGPGASGVGGGLRRFIDRFNSLSMWVSQCVLSRSSPQDRGATVSFFIRVAGHLRDLHNFNGLMAVVTGLQQGSIERLKLTFKNVAKSESIALSKLQKLMSGSKNYQCYREEVSRLVQVIGAHSTTGHNQQQSSDTDDIAASIEWRKYIYQRLHRGAISQSQSNASGIFDYNNDVNDNADYDISTSPHHDSTAGDHDDDSNAISAVVPHIGAHLAELTSVADGNSNFLADNPHLFNIGKFRLLYSTLSALRKMQAMKYNLEPVRAVSAAMNLSVRRHLKLTRGDEQEYTRRMYELSLSLESNEDIASDIKSHGSGNSNKESSSQSQSQQQQQPRVAFSDNTVTKSTAAAAPVSRQKYRKTDAYESILNGTTAKRASLRSSKSEGISSYKKKGTRQEVSSEEDDADNNSDDDSDDEDLKQKLPTASPSRRLFKQASVLLRTMSFVARS